MTTTNSFEHRDFDVIVIGGGHAGIEAASAAARMGSKTLLITLNLDRIGFMPCNPAVGGIGKGHIVYELSALGGLMPKLCTKTYLQARMLNTKKGPAVQGLRLQIDKYAYNRLSKSTLEHMPNLTLLSGMVKELIIKDKKVHGVRTREGADYLAPCVVITTGTFLNGIIHIGLTNYPSGRQGEEAAIGLSDMLKQQGLEVARLKTGTPPRLLRSSIDFSVCQYQEADNLNYLFEFYPHQSEHKRACYITHTNENSHAIIRANLHQSPMYTGNITGRAPRYCPSIEDKVARFPDKTSHHVFIEPESETSEEIYPNGISTSLPYNIQKEFINSIKGFEKAIITRPGYAIEYDFVLPNQLTHTLEVKSISGLFLAGQINGTTGYEEAAGQGIIAGINAHLKQTGQPPFVMDRTQGYIGVMIDDLVTMSVDEPYRMFTSRAERRLLLRQDNVFARLGKISHQLGLISDEFYKDIKQEQDIIESTLSALRKGHNNAELLRLFGDLGSSCAPIIQEQTGSTISERAAQTVQAEIIYGPYIKREEAEVERTKNHMHLVIPSDFDYCMVDGLSTELRQKLTRHKPATIAQAALIPGMTPAAVSLLIFKLRKKNNKSLSDCIDN